MIHIVRLSKSFSVPTSPTSSKAFYVADLRHPDWKGWEVRESDWCIEIIPPSKFTVVKVAHAQVESLICSGPEPVEQKTLKKAPEKL